MTRTHPLPVGAIRLLAALVLLLCSVASGPAFPAAAEVVWTDDLSLWTVSGIAKVKKSQGGTEFPPPGNDDFIFVSNGAGSETVMTTTFEVPAGVDSLHLNLPYNFVSDEYPSIGCCKNTRTTL